MMRTNGFDKTFTRFDAVYRLEVIARLPSAANVFFEIGFTDAVLGSPQNAAFFFFDTTVGV